VDNFLIRLCFRSVQAASRLSAHFAPEAGSQQSCNLHSRKINNFLTIIHFSSSTSARIVFSSLKE